MKLTPWFPGCIEPVHIGVYERHGSHGPASGYAFWNGLQWACSADTPDNALIYSFTMSGYQSDGSIPFKWRGVAKEGK